MSETLQKIIRGPAAAPAKRPTGPTLDQVRTGLEARKVIGREQEGVGRQHVKDCTFAFLAVCSAKSQHSDSIHSG